MINFFRKIRKQLADDNKPLKYARYAIGEIVLVVIGILIALSINNWNVNHKSKAKELKILQNIKVSLETDYNYLKWSNETYEVARKSMDYLIIDMEEDLPYKDSLNYHFSNITLDWGFKVDFTMYEELKSSGTAIISSESLRSNIISYYVFAEGWGLDYSKRYTAILEDASKTIFPKHFDQMWDIRVKMIGEVPNGKMVPFDYELLKKDNEFRYFLKTLKNQNYWLINNPSKKALEKYIEISNEIDKEISALKK